MVPSLSKQGQVRNISCENEFYLNDNENTISVSKAEHLTLF